METGTAFILDDRKRERRQRGSPDPSRRENEKMRNGAAKAFRRNECVRVYVRLPFQLVGRAARQSAGNRLSLVGLLSNRGGTGTRVPDCRMSERHHLAGASPALRRLASLAPLDTWSFEAIEAALAKAQKIRRRRDLLAEGKPIAARQLLVGGWAARVRILADGRRQFLSFLLPGDLVGYCRQPAPLAAATITTLTEVEVCPVPQTAALDGAYAVSAAFDEAYLLEQITRLGRMTAMERIYSLFLELHERLARAGLVSDTGFDMPLTQEMLGDALGLTAVHINRMLQDARRAGQLEITGGRVRLYDPAALAEHIGREPVRVTEPFSSLL